MVTDTGPGYASPGFYIEQGIVGWTLYKCIVHIEELILLPVQAGTGMGATIDVGMKLPVFVHNKNLNGVFAWVNAEPLATGVFNFIAVTKSYGQMYASESRFLMIFNHGFMREYNISSMKY